MEGAPSLEDRATRKFKTFEETASEQRGPSFQVWGGNGAHVFCCNVGDVQQIDVKLVGVEKHAASVGPEAGLIAVFVEHRPKLRETPPERSSGIVRRVPKHLA
jgi:hypothetical protein